MKCGTALAKLLKFALLFLILFVHFLQQTKICVLLKYYYVQHETKCWP